MSLDLMIPSAQNCAPVAKAPPLIKVSILTFVIPLALRVDLHYISAVVLHDQKKSIFLMPVYSLSAAYTAYAQDTS